MKLQAGGRADLIDKPSWSIPFQRRILKSLDNTHPNGRSVWVDVLHSSVVLLNEEAGDKVVSV